MTVYLLYRKRPEDAVAEVVSVHASQQSAEADRDSSPYDNGFHRIEAHEVQGSKDLFKMIEPQELKGAYEKASGMTELMQVEAPKAEKEPKKPGRKKK